VASDVRHSIGHRERRLQLDSDSRALSCRVAKSYRKRYPELPIDESPGGLTQFFQLHEFDNWGGSLYDEDTEEFDQVHELALQTWPALKRALIENNEYEAAHLASVIRQESASMWKPVGNLYDYRRERVSGESFFGHRRKSPRALHVVPTSGRLRQASSLNLDELSCAALKRPECREFAHCEIEISHLIRLSGSSSKERRYRPPAGSGAVSTSSSFLDASEVLNLLRLSPQCTEAAERELSKKSPLDHVKKCSKNQISWGRASVMGSNHIVLVLQFIPFPHLVTARGPCQSMRRARRYRCARE
jgi:hypothetical protein